MVPLVVAHARLGLLPVDVVGDVEWLVNRTAAGWLLTLLNPAGINKPQHGILPTDYAQERVVQIRAAHRVSSAAEWFTNEPLPITGAAATDVTLTVPAGGVRIVEFR